MVIGNDGISSIMILNSNSFFVKSFILPFFQFMFKFCVIPEGFNISHIILIIKDSNKSSTDPNNLRPISISKCFAQIFERLLLLKMPEINFTSDFNLEKFGYKNKISCSHALFAFKETIIKHLEEKLSIYAASLDAVKAFDKLWREALYYKLNQKGINKSAIFILRIYYNVLASMIKINNMKSSVLELKRGVKQGCDVGFTF